MYRNVTCEVWLMRYRIGVEANIRLPEGYHIEYGGQFESEAAASRTLLLTSLMSLLVIALRIALSVGVLDKTV